MCIRHESRNLVVRLWQANNVTGRTRFWAEVWRQRWAPGTYNPRALGVSLGISGHRTDLVKSLLKLDRDRAQNERELIKAGSGTDRSGNLTERIRLTISNTRPRSSGNRSESQPSVLYNCNVKSHYLSSIGSCPVTIPCKLYPTAVAPPLIDWEL